MPLCVFKADEADHRWTCVSLNDYPLLSPRSNIVRIHLAMGYTSFHNLKMEDAQGASTSAPTSPALFLAEQQLFNHCITSIPYEDLPDTPVEEFLHDQLPSTHFENF